MNSGLRLAAAACLLFAPLGCNQDHEGPGGAVPPIDGETDTEGHCGPYCVAGVPNPPNDEDDEFLCGPRDLDVVLTDKRVLLLLDTSGSMLDTWDHDQNPATEGQTRWNTLHAVVSDLLHADDDVQLGVLLFPGGAGHLECTVANEPEIPVGDHDADQVLGSIPPADAGPMHIFGATPSPTAVSIGAEHLLGLGGDQPGAMVLVTDGPPTCQGSDDLVIAVGNYADDGIPIFVIGVDVGADLEAYLDSVADAGNTTRHYDAFDEEDLSEAFDLIFERIDACVLALDPIPELPEGMRVFVDGEEVPRVDECDGADGWRFEHEPEQHASIELCGSWCEALAIPETEVVADYACPPITPGP